MKTLREHLESAHDELVAARKLAALSKHDSYTDIGDAIECTEAALVWKSDERKERIVRLRALKPRFKCPKKYCQAEYDMDSMECPECGHDTPRIVSPSGALMTLGEWCDWVDSQPNNTDQQATKLAYADPDIAEKLKQAYRRENNGR